MKVTPAAKAGRDEGYLGKLNLTAHEGIMGSCAVTTQALTGMKPAVCNDIASDERMADLRSEALSRGYRSMATFPLVVEAWPVGMFALYAAEPDAFDEEEMKLLIEMAGDISFALDHLKKEQRLNYLAFYDELTGLSNRTLFYDRLNQFIHAAADSGTIVAVVVIDLERFRLINETLGRQAGDGLLKLVAERLRAAGLDTQHLSRIGADCYAVVLDHLGKEADVAQFLEKDLIRAIGRPFDLSGTELQVAAKAGIAFFPGDGGDAETLLRNAEAALAKTKLSGGRYSFYTPELNAQVAEKLTLENKLRRALEQEQFVLHYQPKVSLKDGQIVGVEALIRWNDPKAGLVPPAKFIPMLEETGMILDVGKWALQKAVADVARWQENGVSPPRVAVNVSSIQLRQGDFVDMIKAAMQGKAEAMQYLELEITESLIMQDIEVNIRKLDLIRQMGATVAVDDFGTGYSSLSYIAKLPVNTLKIDRAFIINMVNNPDDLSIVSAIISLAHSLDLKVVAEGVETREQANLLRLLKCDEIQGYLFSAAVPAEQIGAFLRERKSLSM
jgi:diguanylate cyclase (GGDEF)-like protein